jgi:mxaK protein
MSRETRSTHDWRQGAGGRTVGRFRLFRRTIDLAAALFLAASLIMLIGAGASWLAGLADNRLIAALRADRDVKVNDDASGAVIFARASFLLTHRRVDEAQGLAETLARRSDQRAFESLLFNLGNARLRQAFESISNGDLSAAIPFVNLAKQNFRRVLELDPGNWNAKYNLDVALRLVRDFPLGQENEGDALPAAKQLWPDMPGVPEGLP